MRIPHRELEEVRKAPVTYISRSQSMSSYYRLSQYRIWQLSLRHYHSENRQRAIRYLEKSFKEKFSNTKRNRRRLIEFIDHITRYCNDYEQLRHHTIEVGKRIDIDLGYNVHIVGEIPRVDLVLNGGYAVYLFMREQYNWRAELRMPLIQEYFVNYFKCPYSEVNVGVYCLAVGSHENISFSTREITNAKNEALRLAKNLEYNLP